VYITPSITSVSPILARGAAFNVIPPARLTLMMFFCRGAFRDVDAVLLDGRFLGGI
jgi:hypothetical protein